MNALKRTFLLRDVSEPAVQLVARTVEEVTVPAGEVLISPVEVPNALYVIRSGTLSMVPAEDARPIQFGSGETIGEAQFVDGEPAGITVVALERAELLVLHRERIDDELARHPEAAFELYRALARLMAGRLRRAAGMLVIAKEQEASP